MFSSLLNKLNILTKPRYTNGSTASRNQGNSVKNLREVFELIMMNNANLNDMIINGTILPFLNGVAHFERTQIMRLLISFNQFKCTESNHRSVKGLFIMILNSDFISEALEPIVRQYFLSMPLQEDIVVMIKFLSSCIELLPCQFIQKMALLYPSVQVASLQFDDREVESLFSNLKRLIDIAKIKNEDKKVSVNKKMSSKNYEINDFRQFTVFPQFSDIFCLNEDVKLRRNKYAGENKNKNNKYESVDDYLDTQFCLLKEDFVRPLRDSIAAIRANMFTKANLEMKKLQVRMYENTTIGDMFTSQTGLVYNVNFDMTKLKRIDWRKGRRFIFGTLLCFTNNFFDTIYFASVVDSDPRQLEKGCLVVQFQQDPVNEILDNNVFIMLETKDLFEAYKHVLIKLQTFTADNLPFKEHLVFGENVTKPPAFMNNIDLKLIDTVAYVDQDFDNSQNDSFARSLKSSLSLIQGPPGTGKTYVGLKMIKYLVNNFQTTSRNIGPILVVCYTNHALDQFLTDIIESIGVEHVIRVGGRSKIEVMKECNMNTIKWNWIKRKAFSKSLSKRSFQIRQDMEVVTENVIRKYAKIMKYDSELLSFNELNCCMNYNHFNFFQRVKFDNWIKGGDSAVKETNNKNFGMKESLMREECEKCIDKIIYENVLKILEENNVFENEEDDFVLEDPEEILYNQFFLDEDFNLLKYGNRFKNIYNEFNRDEEELVEKDEFVCVANKKLIRNKAKKMTPLTDEQCNSLVDLNVDFDTRLKLYRFWLEKYRIILHEQYEIEKKKFNFLNKEKENISFEEYIAIMKSVKVIGMTTTGAARYGPVLDQVGCRVVVIEEAAEVLESHVVCSLSERCDQLIMIGDHKQLRPKVNVYDLERNYDFGVSLFERLIGNDCEYSTLQFQHRMRPEISKCVKSIYPELKDSENVFEYKSIAGMKTNIYFFNHNEKEKESIEISFKNDFEADFVVKLCEYLINCGHLPKHITVLTFYTGQLYNISNKMRQPFFKGIRVCVVDNFQGEENEIIILSLVRSNDIGRVGFVNSENRLCVAISRAKRGFYAIGNFSLLCSKISLLNDIVTTNLQRNEIGSRLPLECLMHPDEINYYATRVNDFLREGCPAKCDLKLPCGHLCVRHCHRKNPSHSTYKCEMNCDKVCDRELHKCSLMCYQSCKCEEYITIKLPCNHEKEIMCFQRDIKCSELCEKKLDCGHICLRLCHEQCKCELKITKYLGCGHDVYVVCGTDISKIKCLKICNKFLKCTHICKERCSEKCKCKEMIDVSLPCSHKVRLLCSSDLLNFRCSIDVEKDFPCGHVIKYKCYEKLEKCDKPIHKELSCGHKVTIKCGELREDVRCTYKCDRKLSCHHKCTGKCGECYEETLHQECKLLCKKQLKCGHYCASCCHAGHCPPCKERCGKYCGHSPCTSSCGEVCDCKMCKIKCERNFKCIQCKKSSKCSQLCGEVCSVLCTACFSVKYGHDQVYYVMKKCNCYVLKTEFRPIMKLENHQLILDCQRCRKSLTTPYSGVVLMYFKKEFSTLFQTFDKIIIARWTELFNELKEIDYLIINFEEIMENIEKNKICTEDKNKFELSYNFYVEFLKICKEMRNVNGESNIKKYQKDIQNSLFRIIKWLNPFVRNFYVKEIDILNLEKSKILASLDILSYLNMISVTDYGLIHKDCFNILNEIKKAVSLAGLEEMIKNSEEIKKTLKNKEQSTNEEEELVEKILKANDVYKEFGLDKLSIEDKIKEIKKLILRCHPDKNKALKAKNAVQRLLEMKKLLE